MTQFDCGPWTITTTHDAYTLEEEWRALEEQPDTFVTAFQRFDWVVPLYKHRYQDDESTPLIVSFRNKQNHKLEMLWPLALEKQSVLGRLATLSLRFADRRLSDYCIPIIAKDAAKNVSASLILEALKQAAPQVDLIHFEKWIGTEAEAFTQLSTSKFLSLIHI